LKRHISCSTNASDARMAVNLAKIGGNSSQPGSRRNSGITKGPPAAAVPPLSIRIVEAESDSCSPGISTPGYGGEG